MRGYYQFHLTGITLKKNGLFFFAERAEFLYRFLFFKERLILCHLPVTVDDDTCSVTTRHIVPVYHQLFFLYYVRCITMVLRVVQPQ